MNKNNLGAAAAVSGLRDDIVDKEVEQVLMKGGQPKRLASAKPNNYALPEDDDDQEDPEIAIDEDDDDYSDVDGAGGGDADPMEDEMEAIEDDAMEDIEAEQIVNITNKDNQPDNSEEL